MKLGLIITRFNHRRCVKASMPDVGAKDRALAINTLLSEGKIDLFKSAGRGLLYKLRGASSVANTSQGDASSGGEALAGNPAMIRGDAEEKLVYKFIEEAGNKGTWIRDIRINSNLSQVQLNRVLKSLKSKKLIKEKIFNLKSAFEGKKEINYF